MLKRFSTIFISLCLLFSSSLQAATEIIQLKHRPAAELLSAIQPFLEPYERASEWGFQLIVQADEKKIQELRQIIEQIDTPAQRLLISVDMSGGAVSQDNYTGINSNTKNTSVTIKRHSTSTSENGIKTVQALEGSPALIQTGQQIQQKNWMLDRYGTPYPNTIQRDLVQGFYVVATVNGNMVTLELSADNDRLDAIDQRITHSQSTTTRVTGPLNQWIQVSSLHDSLSDSQRGILNKSKTYSTDNSGLRIKVQLLD